MLEFSSAIILVVKKATNITVRNFIVYILVT
jgi:hypothetical protein